MERRSVKKRRLKLNQKIYLYTTVAFCLFSILLLSATILLLQHESNKNTINEEQEIIERESNNFSKSIQSYINLSYALSLSPSVQEFLEATKDNSNLYYDKNDIARSSVKSICEADSNLFFVTIFDREIDDYIFACTSHSLKTMEPKVSYNNDFHNRVPFNDSSFSLSFSNSYFPKENPYLNIYFPINSATTLNHTIGYLCFAVEDQTLQNIIENKSSQMVLTQEGKVIASSLESDFLTDKLQGTSGFYKGEGSYYFYHKVDGTTLFLVDYINANILTSFLPEIFLPLILLIIMFLVIFFFIFRILLFNAYTPMNIVVKAMKEVKDNGNVQHQIDYETFGPDFTQIAKGFNEMMDEINILIIQVKEEQKTKERLRYYMLQAQIKPHFLYNTLECIHWQALADGNETIATMVIALGAYYKTSLNNGNEIITLKKEIELTNNYLVIQNMRFGDILESNFAIDEDFMSLLIPKITLQPLVENAIYHGIRVKMGNKGVVNLTCKRDGKFYCLYLSDTGSVKSLKSASEINATFLEKKPSQGYGIYNVDKRLQLYCGKDCGLTYFDNNQGGITVEIRLLRLEQKG
ncbi:MAG: histidine kinase [Peptostreptococcaceae bacterium]|nr:histidine kinase [Peptostreptococcaceae bacterium]